MSITFALLILTGLVSYQSFNNRRMFDALKHYPIAEHRNKEYYRLVSSGFVHGSMNHLLINGFVLYMFGTFVESHFVQVWGGVKGPLMFLLLYLLSIIVGDIPSHFEHKNNPGYSAVGASGATSAIVLIYCMMDPWNWFIYPPVPAIVFAIGYLAYSHWADKTNKADGIGHSAHLYGGLCGVAFILFTQPYILGEFLSKVVKPTMPSFLG